MTIKIEELSLQDTSAMTKSATFQNPKTVAKRYTSNAIGQILVEKFKKPI